MVTGAVRCPVCGMLAFSQELARQCCEIGGPSHQIEAHGIVAKVVDGGALVAAADQLVKSRGLTGRRGLGMYPSFWWSVSEGRLDRIQAQTWVQLLLLFDGAVPGCVELKGGA